MKIIIADYPMARRKQLAGVCCGIGMLVVMAVIFIFGNFIAYTVKKMRLICKMINVIAYVGQLLSLVGCVLTHVSVLGLTSPSSIICFVTLGLIMTLLSRLAICEHYCCEVQNPPSPPIVFNHQDQEAFGGVQVHPIESVDKTTDTNMKDDHLKSAKLPSYEPSTSSRKEKTS